MIEHDTTWHFECLLGERQLGAGAVDVQDPNIADWGADCCAHQSVWPARAGADLDHQFLWFQLPTAARGAGRNSRHDRSKNHLERWSGIDLPAFRTFVRMMEQELKQEFDAWIRAAQLAGGTGTFKLDLASNRWEWTPQIAVLFGFDPESPRPRFEDWESAIFRDDVPKVRDALEAARRDGFYYVELRVRHPDGSTHWLAGRGKVQRNGSGKARWLLGSYFEITDRKALEARLLVLNEALEDRVQERARQLDASSEQLRESERRFLLLVTAVTDYAIFMLDPEGNIVSWNTGAERIKGYAPEEIIGQHFSRFYTEADRQNGIPPRMLAAALQTGKHEAEGWRVRKDGSTFWAGVVIEAIRAPTGQLLGFAKVTRDLTEKRHAEAQLRQSQKMEAIGQLTGGIAHDFNNLLMVISGNVETLLRHFPESIDQNLRRSANTALDAAGRAAVLTNRLLAFARRQALDPRSLSVNTLISGMSEMLRRTLGESIVIETVLGGGLWRSFVDANHLEGALLNLTINARDAMPDGGKLTIEAANFYLDEDNTGTAEMPSGQYVGISVSDTGTGMTPEVISQAFEPFFTTKEIGQGTGLGLSQVYGFVKQSGGHVKIYSEIGVGTTVQIYLPRYYSDEDAADDRPATVSIPRGVGETILVAEDHPDVRSFTVDMLRELGYRVLEAMDGHAALRVLDAHREIVLLFTDIGLPRGMNGRELAEEAQRRKRGLKVLFTSGYARNAVVHHGRLDRGVELIVKPFTYATLATRVRRMLDN